MAKPKFSVQHFIVCLNASWEGLPSPNTPHTLESVSYVYGVPPNAEFPIQFAELWLYTPLFLLNNVNGVREFIVRTLWLDAPGGARLVRSDNLSPVTFRSTQTVVNKPWVL